MELAGPDRRRPVIDWSEVRCVTSAQADPNQVDLARFGVAVCAQVKSNCVIFIQPTTRIRHSWDWAGTNQPR